MVKDKLLSDEKINHIMITAGGSDMDRFRALAYHARAETAREIIDWLLAKCIDHPKAKKQWDETPDSFQTYPDHRYECWKCMDKSELKERWL